MTVEEDTQLPKGEATMSPTRQSSTEILTATIQSPGQDFPFQIHHRPLTLGPAGQVQYYWMDSSGFRIARTRRGGDPANFRNCIGHWWHFVRSQGLGRDPEQITDLILATCYGLVSGDKALQNVYRDAHLAPAATRPEEQSLPECTRLRIQDVVAGRDADRLRDVLDDWLGRAKILNGHEVLFRSTFEGIISQGVDLVSRDDDDGLEEFLGRFDAWLAKHRKRGAGGWLRPFLDLISYECKVSFYHCYANAWIGIIPWLRENRDLDPASERFLRVWHMQNRPRELPDGQVVPDVFGGQVLALHPLSGFFMKDPALLAIAGRFFLADSFERVMERGQVGDCAEYWDFIGAILTAAALYRQALDRQAERRGVHARPGINDDLASVGEETRSGDGLLEEFAHHSGLRCPHCGGQLRSRGFEPASANDDAFDAEFACSACGHATRHRITRFELQAWMSS